MDRSMAVNMMTLKSIRTWRLNFKMAIIKTVAFLLSVSFFRILLSRGTCLSNHKVFKFMDLAKNIVLV